MSREDKKGFVSNIMHKMKIINLIEGELEMEGY